MGEIFKILGWKIDKLGIQRHLCMNHQVYQRGLDMVSFKAGKDWVSELSNCITFQNSSDSVVTIVDNYVL